MSFTRSLIVFLLRDDSRDDTRDTVREWLEAVEDPHDRAVGFAKALHDDFCAEFAVVQKRYPDLSALLLAEAIQHVNWRSVAEELLERLAPQAAWLTALPSLEPSLN